MTDVAVAVSRLEKTYGAHRAVDGVSFQVGRGGVFGVLGPNGAGKSTTLRIMVGILKADGGEVSLLGGPVSRQGMRRVGYLPEERGLYRSMTPMGILVYLARLKGVRADVARRRAAALLEAHGLGGYAHKRIKALSKGMAQKVQILGAMIHEPDLIILDEPFSGLDPVNQQTVEALIRAQAGAGRTVLFSTHVMEHAERMCNHIVLFARGRAAFCGSMGEALAAVPRAALLETEGGFDLPGALAAHGFTLTEESASQGVRRWRAGLDAGDASRRLLAACVSVGAPLTLFEPTKASLHEAFVRLVGDQASPADPRKQIGWRAPSPAGA